MVEIKCVNPMTSLGHVTNIFTTENYFRSKVNVGSRSSFVN